MKQYLDHGEETVEALKHVGADYQPTGENGILINLPYACCSSDHGHLSIRLHSDDENKLHYWCFRCQSSQDILKAIHTTLKWGGAKPKYRGNKHRRS